MQWGVPLAIPLVDGDARETSGERRAERRCAVLLLLLLLLSLRIEFFLVVLVVLVITAITIFLLLLRVFVRRGIRVSFRRVSVSRRQRQQRAQRFRVVRLTAIVQWPAYGSHCVSRSLERALARSSASRASRFETIHKISAHARFSSSLHAQCARAIVRVGVRAEHVHSSALGFHSRSASSGDDG